jgi:A/G-specific adenine glycosylase
VAWQRVHGRHDLPWQGSRDPYRVWLSEIMLQQTQVTTVCGYYARFLARFPDVAALAAAPLDEVLGLWSGLGYYSRARNLHRCAQLVMTQHGGVFPRSAALLAELPGIGASTAAAIAAFCFGERISILDGNVRRVLARLLGFGEDLASARHVRSLNERAQTLLPADAADMPAYTQGLMDLGATVCLPRQANCDACPWQRLCVARAEGRPSAYPVRSRKVSRQATESWCLWLADARGAVWLQQRPTPGIWAGLWAWPMFDDEAACRRVAAEVIRLARGGADAQGVEALEGFKHVLTHRDWTMHPRRLVLACADALPAEVLAECLGPGRWWPQSALADLGLPAPLRQRLPIA